MIVVLLSSSLPSERIAALGQKRIWILIMKLCGESGPQETACSLATMRNGPLHKRSSPESRTCAWTTAGGRVLA